MKHLLQDFLKDILEHACTFTYNPAGAGGLREEQAIARSGITRCLTRCITLACSCPENAFQIPQRFPSGTTQLDHLQPVRGAPQNQQAQSSWRGVPATRSHIKLVDTLVDLEILYVDGYGQGFDEAARGLEESWLESDRLQGNVKEGLITGRHLNPQLSRIEDTYLGCTFRPQYTGRSRQTSLPPQVLCHQGRSVWPLNTSIVRLIEVPYEKDGNPEDWVEGTLGR